MRNIRLNALLNRNGLKTAQVIEPENNLRSVGISEQELRDGMSQPELYYLCEEDRENYLKFTKGIILERELLIKAGLPSFWGGYEDRIKNLQVDPWFALRFKKLLIEAGFQIFGDRTQDERFVELGKLKIFIETNSSGSRRRTSDVYEAEEKALDLENQIKSNYPFDSCGVWGFTPSWVNDLAYACGVRKCSAKFNWLATKVISDFKANGRVDISSGVQPDTHGIKFVTVDQLAFFDRGLKRLGSLVGQQRYTIVKQERWYDYSDAYTDYQMVDGVLARVKPACFEEIIGTAKFRTKDIITLGRVSLASAYILAKDYYTPYECDSSTSMELAKPATLLVENRYKGDRTTLPRYEVVVSPSIKFKRGLNYELYRKFRDADIQTKLEMVDFKNEICYDILGLEPTRYWLTRHEWEYNDESTYFVLPHYSRAKGSVAELDTAYKSYCMNYAPHWSDGGCICKEESEMAHKYKSKEEYIKACAELGIHFYNSGLLPKYETNWYTPEGNDVVVVEDKVLYFEEENSPVMKERYRTKKRGNLLILDTSYEYVIIDNLNKIEVSNKTLRGCYDLLKTAKQRSAVHSFVVANKQAILDGEVGIPLSLEIARKTGFCISGTRNFLKTNKSYLYLLLDGCSNWAEVPAEILAYTTDFYSTKWGRFESYFNRL